MTNAIQTPISLIEIKLKDLTDCSGSSGDLFTAEASSLGWKPGSWPQNLAVQDLGNGESFYAIKQDSDGIRYHQNLGCIDIMIFND